jgi:hypothetical protein
MKGGESPAAEPPATRVPSDASTEPADDSETVVVSPDDFRLPDVLRHIEAGKVVLVMPHHPSDD